MATAPKVIDSHLHVWSAAWPSGFASAPPDSLGDDVSSAEALLAAMDASGVDKSLIVQPSVYAFDHSYVLDCMGKHPDRLAVMLLADPTKEPEEACDFLRTLHGKGCCGVRFNPYLWPEGQQIDNPTGVEMYKVAGELGMPVGVMAFKGLKPLAEPLRHLAAEAPATPLIIDHWGFFRDDPASPPAAQAVDEEAFELLLALAQDIPQLYVKISALFRVSGTGGPQYDDLRPRFQRLVDVLGSRRLMYGSDFPFVQLHEGQYGASVEAVRAWVSELDPEDAARILGGTAAELFNM